MSDDLEARLREHFANRAARISPSAEFLSRAHHAQRAPRWRFRLPSLPWLGIAVATAIAVVLAILTPVLWTTTPSGQHPAAPAPTGSISLELGSSQVSHGAPLLVSGQVRPARAGVEVYGQQLVNGRWTTMIIEKGQAIRSQPDGGYHGQLQIADTINGPTKGKVQVRTCTGPFDNPACSAPATVTVS
ncbi:hypothetical protein K4749_38945 [Streptomyces sp. TRM72054]|uniref:hypothetical protein n=1 Tax=Streptomyces sp. TRM72054 TaxID=2870562 RepID=UPI001C8B5C03|nr:hypothetical protein [Streptomyces sp. TRM72054]MBX9399372.1 hypothetical protein [Streptomyces sp. TRM72054]